MMGTGSLGVDPMALLDATSPTVLIVGVILSVFGMAYFSYGKKQEMAMPMICGLTLTIFPFFVSSLWILLGVGAVLIVLPFFFQF